MAESSGGVKRGSPRFWTEERLEALRRCLAEGATLAEAGLRMGVSREAIAGACHRYLRPALGNHRYWRKGGGLELAVDKVRLGRDCQFIAGRPSGGDACKCGKPVHAPGAMYCAEHHALCHRQPGSVVEPPPVNAGPWR